MRVLVTGGAGFIGSHLVDRLVADGHTVSVLERYSEEKKAFLTDIFGKKITVVWADISSTSPSLIRYFRSIDWVFHMAGKPNVFDVDPMLFHKANVDGTIQVLEASRKARVSRFVYPASISCYGDAKMYSTAETAPVRLQYPYALTKYLGERYVLHWGSVYQLPVVSLRLANVYGTRLHPQQHWGAITSFMLPKIRSTPFRVRGNGSQSRDYVFVTDAVEACIMAVQSDVAGEIFNVGMGRETTVNELIRLLGGGEREYLPERPEEIVRMCVDVTKIRKRLGWRPAVSFEEGLKKVLAQSATSRHIAMAHRE